MTDLALFDDAVARRFEPFALSRPIGSLRAGVWTTRQRWSHVLGTTRTVSVVAAHLAEFDEPGESWIAADRLEAGCVLVNSRCVPRVSAAGTMRADDPSTICWTCGGRVAAVRLATPVHGTELDSLEWPPPGTAGSARASEVDGWWMDEVWDFVRLLPEQLAADIADAQDAGVATPLVDEGGRVTPGVAVLGRDRPPRVESHVVLDTSEGPILLGPGAVVHSFSRIVGPCYIGRDVIVQGDSITACAIGERCKVRGELSHTVLLGHSNKGHDGFVGHSYLGRWVNLGAGTITSNLKNTYGSVGLWTPDGVRDTGMQFLGTLFGDHVKTAIGTRLNTGTVIGAGANVFGIGMPPKACPPFAWGLDGETYALDRFLAAAERAMGRRQVELDARARRLLSEAYRARWSVTS